MCFLFPSTVYLQTPASKHRLGLTDPELCTRQRRSFFKVAPHVWYEAKWSWLKMSSPFFVQKKGMVWLSFSFWSHGTPPSPRVCSSSPRLRHDLRSRCLVRSKGPTGPRLSAKSPLLLLDNTQCVWLEEETVSTWRLHFSQKVIKTSCKRICFRWRKERLHFLTSDFRTCTEASTHNILAENQQRRWGKRGAFSRMLGCPDVKDAFLQAPQEKPLKWSWEEKNS